MTWLILLALASSGVQVDAISQHQVWDTLGNFGKYKCHTSCARDGCTKESQASCQNRAEALGHKYYSYRAFDQMCTTSAYCSPTETTSDWHSYQVMWPEIKKGNYKCHGSCAADGCTVVPGGQAECQSLALAKGKAFYSYRDSDQMCRTQYSCSNLAITSPGPMAWRSFKMPEAQEQVKVWKIVDNKKYLKCHSNCTSHECVPVKNEAECRGRARLAGHLYYSYLSSARLCATSTTCTGRQTIHPWVGGQQMGERVMGLEGSYKCHSKCTYGPGGSCFPVGTRGECQANAEAQGDNFYSFRPADKMCSTSKSCDFRPATQVEWRAFSVM